MAIRKQLTALGVERPIFSKVVKSDKNFTLNYRFALMFAHTEMTTSALKKEVVKYIKKLDPRHELLDRVQKTDDKKFCVIGKYMYILNNGGDVPDEVFPTIMPALERILGEEKKTKTKEATGDSQQETGPITYNKNTKAAPSIQDRLREKASVVAAEVEGWIDDFYLDRSLPSVPVENFVNLFKIHELKPQHIRHVRIIFERIATEMKEVMTWKDKDLKEGYSNFSKTDIKKLNKTYDNLFIACDMIKATKKTKIARAKKPISQEKLVSKIKYQKEDKKLGLVSAHPIEILGAKEIWVYNTKTRKLANIKALDVTGLMVKGTALTNISPDSVEKTLRQPDIALAAFKKASKTKLPKFLDTLSTVGTKVKERLTSTHIILKVI